MEGTGRLGWAQDSTVPISDPRKGPAGSFARLSYSASAQVAAPSLLSSSTWNNIVTGCEFYTYCFALVFL